MICVAYCRVSTDEKEQLTSFENQREYYTQLFAKGEYTPAKCGMLHRKGQVPIYNEDGIFADEGISGTKLKNREAFNHMMKLAKERMFDTILVKNIPRFSRSIVDGASALQKLNSYGVNVIFEDIKAESNNPLVVNILMSLAQDESRAKSESVKFGHKQFRKRGGWTGTPVYGYDLTKGFLSINQEEAKIVKLIFDLYLNYNKGYHSIATILKESNIRTKKGGLWRDMSIHNMLVRELYIGKIVSGKTTSVDINLGTTKKLPKEEWTVVEKPELRIIDDDTFNKVQSEISKRANQYANTGHKITDKLLSGLLICGHCKTSYVRKPRGRGEALERLGYYWTCRSNDKGIPYKDKNGDEKICQHRYMLLEGSLIDVIKAKIAEIKKADLSNEFDVYLDIFYHYEPKKISELQDKIKALIKHIDMNFELYVENGDKEAYYRRDSKYKEKKAIVERKLDILINNKLYREKAQKAFNEYMICLKAIDTENLTNQTLKTVFNKITVKSYGETLNKNIKNLVIKFDYNFLETSISEIIEKIGKDNNELLNRLSFLDYASYSLVKCGIIS